MNIFFIGSVEFSKATLGKIISLNYNVVGVATKKTSAFNSDHADLSDICKVHNIPFRYVTDINSEDTIAWVHRLGPDIIFCFGWSDLLKEPLLNLSPLGVIGFHPAELPQNRGRHPLIWALALGLHRTASTFFFMDTCADSGDILCQSPIFIDYQDNARTLYDKTIQTALEQIEQFLPKLDSGNYCRIPQDARLANYWRKRNESDGEIDFKMHSRAIYNLVRALTKPYVGAHIAYKKKKIKVWRVQEEQVSKNNIEPGKILDLKDNCMLIKCAKNAVWIVDHEFTELPGIGEYIE